MTNKEAINYLIAPIATSTEPSAQYLKQKEAYELAIRALKERPTGEWLDNDREDTYRRCSICNELVEKDNYCGNCGADMRKGEEDNGED